MILSNYQRPECIGSVTGSLRVASDDEIVLARLLDLQPAPRAAARFIDAIRTLRDDPLHAEIERSLVGVLAVLGKVADDADSVIRKHDPVKGMNVRR